MDMTKKTNFPHMRYMDGEYLFQYYFQTMGEARSLPKLVAHCKENYIIHPETGKPPTRMGIYKAIWRWATKKENQQTAWEIYKNSQLGDEWKMITDWDEWMNFLKERITSARQFAKPNEYRNFLKYNGYQI